MVRSGLVAAGTVAVFSSMRSSGLRGVGKVSMAAGIGSAEGSVLTGRERSSRFKVAINAESFGVSGHGAKNEPSSFWRAGSYTKGKYVAASSTKKSNGL